MKIKMVPSVGTNTTASALSAANICALRTSSAAQGIHWDTYCTHFGDESLSSTTGNEYEKGLDSGRFCLLPMLVGVLSTTEDRAQGGVAVYVPLNPKLPIWHKLRENEVFTFLAKQCYLQM